jgi:SAM-dependent methyltransferase
VNPIGTMSTDPGPPAADPVADEHRALGWYVRMTRRYLGPGPYLDFGCGTGLLLRALARRGPCSGFEPDADLAALARRTAPGCPVVTDPAELSDGAFRGIVAVDALARLDDTAARDAVRVWRRVLRPGGRALVVAPDSAGRARELADGTDVVVEGAGRARSHEQWREFLVGAGFVVVREGSDGLHRPPYGRVPTALDTRTVPAFAQMRTSRLYLAPGSGESAVFVVECPG